MKQIIPFKKDLLFKTKVSEVTSISLEHSFKVDDDLISGSFHINGDYKMTEGSIQREKFDFDLPFDIALDSRFERDSMIVDIDNFYYQIINNDTLQVNIDLFVDGEKVIEEEREIDAVVFDDFVKELDNNFVSENDVVSDFRIDKDIEFQKVETLEEIMNNEIISESEIEESKNIYQSINVDNNDNNKQDFNFFDNVDESETYKAYYVYVVKDGDTIDKILEKYCTTKEKLELYNDLEDIKPGDKVIIPSKNE